jgi:hypothetical protein
MATVPVPEDSLRRSKPTSRELAFIIGVPAAWWRILALVSKSLNFGVFPLRVAGGPCGVAAGTPDEVAVARA